MMGDTRLFTEKVENTVSSLVTFFHEVEEMGWLEKVSLHFDVASARFEDAAAAACYSYTSALKDLVEKLQVIVKELQVFTANAPMHLNSLNNNTNQGTNETEQLSYAGEYINEITFPQSSTLVSKKSDKYKCLFPNEPNMNFNKGIAESDLEITEKATKDFNESLLYEGQYCSSNSLVAPFENLAITSQIFNPSLCNTVSDQQQIHPISSLASESDLTSSSSAASTNCTKTQTIQNEVGNIHQKQLLKTEGRKVSVEEAFNENNSFLRSKKVGESTQMSGDDAYPQMKSSKPRKKNLKFPQFCFTCNQAFKTSKHFTAHNEKYHNEEGGYEQEAENGSDLTHLPIFCCKTCNVACQTLSNFGTHVCSLSDQEEMQPSKRILITSLKKLQQVRKFVCYICGTEFRSLKRILYHNTRCVPGPYGCNVCPEVFYSVKDLNYHKKKDHRNEKCFLCDECGNTFFRKSSLRKHCINRHESKVLAEVVGADKSATHKCDLCPKKFIKKIFLTNHKIRAHGLEKNYLCQVCGKKLMNSNSLMTHMEIHIGEKKFVCKFCDRKFRRKEKLLYHERMHTGERPFICGRCEKGFVSRTRLNEHARRHDAEKRFQCLHCAKSYASLGDLKKHSMKCHKMLVPSECVKVTLRRKSGRSDDGDPTGQITTNVMTPEVDSVPVYDHQSSASRGLSQIPYENLGEGNMREAPSSTSEALYLHPMTTEGQHPFVQVHSNVASIHFSDI